MLHLTPSSVWPCCCSSWWGQSPSLPARRLPFSCLHRARAGWGSTPVYQPVRAVLGRSILLGLEFLVAGDILKSLVINPSLDDLLVLAGLILVRTFLSVSLGVEINGHWPWQETAMANRTQTKAHKTEGEG